MYWDVYSVSYHVLDVCVCGGGHFDAPVRLLNITIWPARLMERSTNGKLSKINAKLGLPLPSSHLNGGGRNGGKVIKIAPFLPIYVQMVSTIV